MTHFSIIALVCFAIACLWIRWCMASLEPRDGEAPEDDGAAYDAHTCHTCRICGARVAGPKDGFKLPDCVCWNCAGIVSYNE